MTLTDSARTAGTRPSQRWILGWAALALIGAAGCDFGAGDAVRNAAGNAFTPPPELPQLQPAGAPPGQPGNQGMVAASPVDNALRQKAYEDQLERERASRKLDVKSQFEQQYGRDKVVTLTINGVTGDVNEATKYISRKLFKAAYHDYEQSSRRAAQATKANQEQAKQQALAQHQQTWGTMGGPMWVRYQYQAVDADLPYPRVQQGTTANGTYVYYVAPVLNIDEFTKRFPIGQVSSVDNGNRAVTIQSLIPDPVPDIDLEELLIKHGKSSIATLKITGADGDEPRVSYFLERQIVKLDPQINLEAVGPKKKGKGEYELTVGPVSSLQLLGERIGFGNVTNIDDQTRVISVAATLPADLPERPSQKELDAQREKEAKLRKSDWDKEPKEDEDVLSWAMRIIKGGNSFACDAAYARLSTMTPDEEHLKPMSEVLIATLPNVGYFRLEKHLQVMTVWKTEEGTKAILGLLGDTNPNTRGSAIKALGRLPSKQAAQAVAARMTDFFDAKEATFALRQMGLPAEDAVLRLADSPAASMRAEAYSILADIGNEKTLAKLRTYQGKERDRNAKGACKLAIDQLKSRLESEKEDKDEDEKKPDDKKKK